MAANRPRHTLGDYLAIAISPALIMALVGSLVFFLLEVLYVGKYEGRMRWILFCFIFAAVLIARVQMNQGISDRAPLYGLVLGVLVYIGLQRFVEYPEDVPLAGFGWAINLGLMALIWWCAHRLTWDCTLVDDSTEGSGEGLLAASGLEQPATAEGTTETGPADGQPASHPEPASEPESPRGDRARRTRERSGLLAWWDRWHDYQEAQRRRPRNPGVWVVYFSLAALPLFGLGQSLIPVEEGARRRYAFWLIAVYLASGLGLLLATHYLGLRRYLRQRNLTMPVSMTGVWLIMGGILVSVLLLVGAVLPRPAAEFPILPLGSSAGSPERQASRYAVKTDSAGEGEGRSSSDQSQKDPEGQPSSTKSQDKADSQGGRGQADSKSSSSGQNKGQGQGRGKSGQDSSQRSQSQQGQGQSRGQQSSQNSSNRSGKPAQGRQQGRAGKDGRDGSSERKDSSSSEDKSSSWSSIFHTLSRVLKWVVFAALAVAVVVVLMRSGLQYLANFTDWARRLLAALEAWWQRLFGGRPERAAEAETEAVARARELRPFASYTNPFESGRADRLSPEELVRYTFEAFEAFARERGVGRGPEQTPLEFAAHAGKELPALEADARRLASLYARTAYGHGRLPAATPDALRQFWQHLEAVAESRLSAAAGGA
jgi:hypothetical protein